MAATERYITELWYGKQIKCFLFFLAVHPAESLLISTDDEGMMQHTVNHFFI